MIDLTGIKNIIFDFGGVLFEIDYNAPVREFEKLGNHGFAELHSQSAQNPIFDEFETGNVTNEIFLNFLHSFVPLATMEQVAYAWNSILLHIMPPQVDVVIGLKEKGYRTFLLSNTNAMHVAAFEKMVADKMDFEKFKGAFEKIYYSNVIGLKKPDPETFLKVCAWNQLIPEETLFIDDSIQHIIGAQEAGLRAYHLKNGERINQAILI